MSKILFSNEMRELREVMNTSLLIRAEETIISIVSKYPKTGRIWDHLGNDSLMSAQWDMADYIAATKMRYNAHGDIHSKIMTANALKMLDILHEAGVELDIVRATQETSDWGDRVESGDLDDAHLVILLSELLHDTGDQVNRPDHDLHSKIPAIPILDKIISARALGSEFNVGLGVKVPLRKRLFKLGETCS